MFKTDLTPDAKQAVGGFVQRAGKTFLVVRCGDVFGDEQTIRVTPDDVAAFFATQARNLASGCRTLAGLTRRLAFHLGTGPSLPRLVQMRQLDRYEASRSPPSPHPPVLSGG